MKVGKELAKEAKRLEICKEWYSQLREAGTKEAMVAMYLKGIDFCMENNYPSNEYIRTNFKGMMEPFGVFLDEAVELVNMAKCVLLGGCHGRLEVNGYACSEVFVRHETEVRIVGKGHAFVMVDVYDNARVHVEVWDDAKVCLNKHGKGMLVDIVEYGKGRGKIMQSV